MISASATSLDRTKNPEYRLIESFELIHASERRLSNGIPVYSVNGAKEEVVKLEFIFPAGIWYEQKVNLAHAVNSLINNGSKKMTSAEIAEEIDYYGGFMQTEITYDQGILSLYCLSKHLAKVLPVIEEILIDAAFPEDELQIYIQNSRQRMEVNLQKNDYVARKHLTRLLFGNSHPFGTTSSPEDYDKITREEILQFYKECYAIQRCTIIASGNIQDEVYQLLEKHFGHYRLSNDQVPETIHIVEPQDEHRFYLPKKDSLQSAIRIGKLVFNRTHADYIGFQVLSTILGGYFGSRLMANIRENKGYTYGVGAGIVSMFHAGYFFIGTEVGCDVTDKALKEIYKEIDILKVQPVPAEELALVKNYMIGTFMGSLENIFAYADKFKNIHFYGLGYDFYEKFFHTVKTIQPPQLMDLANKYFQADSLSQVVVGKKTHV